MRKAEDKAREYADRALAAGKAAGRRIGSFLLKKLAVLLLPFLPWVLVGVAVFLGVAVLVAGIYSTMSPQSYMTGVVSSPQDKVIKAKYERLTSTVWGEGPAWNAADTYLVPEESFRRFRYYPQTGFENMHALKDKYRHDFDLRLRWGTVHAVCLYWQYIFNKQEIPDWLREKVAKDLHPHFYYIKRTESYSVSCPKGSHSETRDVYLLVEAHTIYGWYQYHYEEVTETHRSGECTVTTRTWQFKDTIQLWPDRYQWIKQYLKNLYKLDGILDKEKQIEQTRYWVMEAGEGFTQQKEWLQWLISNYGAETIASGAMVPPEYMPFLKEAEERFGIPWWFLAAVFQRESSWDPTAVNTGTGCFGISQQHPDYWKDRWLRLGFSPPELYQWDPRAQILAGALVLADYIGDPKSIDWKNDGWKSDPQVLKALAKYGGFGDDVDRAINGKEHYIPDILGYAEGMQAGAVWPVPGYRKITGWFHEPRPGHLHQGIDIAAPEDTAVVSVSGGAVVFAGWWGGYGNTVCVYDGVHMYLYAHLSEIDVSEKQAVRPGDRIGAVGNTGNSYGPHLHFGVTEGGLMCPYRDDPDAHWINPLLVVQPQ
ncbi:M23 family metallopeptidase [Desulfofundulus thermosubterraneus]|uniref:Transglycosylase SLT domain-containing protein n=1 Tax=Desulfofundulus thermosubterraneus DSM 16057 TaxID=1121432 RepID=A0A1M6JBE7_9FIRM|nr:peptidoglycan DD-metalloendopeptidase family protein [Desulfofundulus thermosubterraneus]SHJ44001.1 Transglycosylase SLT domain-containing protein [Desulfofundulus thermosubterraneus DSM 16057]